MYALKYYLDNIFLRIVPTDRTSCNAKLFVITLNDGSLDEKYYIFVFDDADTI